jgi:hypothetical protein
MSPIELCDSNFETAWPDTGTTLLRSFLSQRSIGAPGCNHRCLPSSKKCLDADMSPAA